MLLQQGWRRVRLRVCLAGNLQAAVGARVGVRVVAGAAQAVFVGLLGGGETELDAAYGVLSNVEVRGVHVGVDCDCLRLLAAALWKRFHKQGALRVWVCGGGG